MKTIAIISQKGGCGKTSICMGIGTKLATDGYKVLFVDADMQSNLSSVFYVDTEHGTLYDVLREPYKIKDVIIRTEYGDILPGSPKLALYQGNITALKQALEKVRTEYDFCLIDNPPALGDISLNSLLASDYCIIPLHADYLGFYSIDQTMQTIISVKKKSPELEVLGLLLNEYRGNARITKVCEEMIKEKAQEYGTKVFETRIRNCIKIQESEFSGEPNIIKYSKGSNAAADFTALTNEIEGMLK